MYDGSCPICTREIAMYQQLPARQPIEWVDVSRLDASAQEAALRAQWMERFHVQTADGQWLVGARAFVHLWQQLPRWRYLAWLAHIPGAVPCMDAFYRLFLRVRPRLQRWASRA